MPGSVLVAANGPNSWVWWHWVGTHGSLIRRATEQHVELTAVAIGAGLAISFPLALMARRWRWTESPVLGAAGVLYTIPSLAALGLLIPITGLTKLTAEITLTSYTLLILVRNVVAGLDGVANDVKEAARGMGFTSTGQLLRVELPLALPAIVAGLRIATVSTVGLVTVTALIGVGGLGELIYDGLIRSFRTPLVVGSVLSVALAVFADVSLAMLQRRLSRWNRARA